MFRTLQPLQWSHNERDGISNHCCLNCLAQPFVQAQIKENIWGDSLHKGPVTGKKFLFYDIIMICFAVHCFSSVHCTIWCTPETHHLLLPSLFLGKHCKHNFLYTWQLNMSNLIEMISSDYAWYQQCKKSMESPCTLRISSLFKCWSVDFKMISALFPCPQSQILCVSMVFICDIMEMTGIGEILHAAYLHKTWPPNLNPFIKFGMPMYPDHPWNWLNMTHDLLIFLIMVQFGLEMRHMLCSQLSS